MMTRGGGKVSIPPKSDDVIYEHPLTCKSFPGWMPLESEDFDEEVIDAGHEDTSDNSIALENENREVKRLESNLQSQVT